MEQHVPKVNAIRPITNTLSLSLSLSQLLNQIRGVEEVFKSLSV